MSDIQFVDLHKQYLSIKGEIDEAISSVIAESAFVRGPRVDKFEEEFASAMRAAHCVSCANGTDALYIAMHALSVKPGDEVITTAQSWISTSETISQHGAVPVFVDIDPATHTIDPAKIAEKITDQTVGIIPVHLYGQAADMDPIMRIASERGLWVIEDCAQAHLATYNKQMVGTIGTIGTFSFYPGKNLGAMGDAGAAVTSDAALARKMSRFARHGGLQKGQHEIEGINSRLDGLQAAILSVKLPHLAQWTEGRRKVASLYGDLLKNVAGLDLPVVAEGRTHVFHLYVIMHERRDELRKYLADSGIPTVINYPAALPFLPAYDRFGHTPDDFPVAHHHQQRILSLPIYPELEPAHIELIAEKIRAFVAG